MRYRIAQIGLIVLGIIFAMGALAPIPPASGGGTAGALGTLFGKLIVVFLCIGCFVGARRAGINARRAKDAN